MAEEAKDTGKKGGKTGLLMVAVAVIGLAAGGGGAAMMLGKSGGGSAHAPSASSSSGGHGGGHSSGGGGEHGGPTAVPMDAFVVNLADPAGDRFLKLTLRFVVNDAGIAEQLKSDDLVKARVRDKVISVLTSKMFSDISSTVGKEGLRRELIHDVNQVLPTEAIQEVLFVDLAIQ